MSIHKPGDPTSKDRVLNIRISAEGLARLKRAAELEGVSTSAFVTRAALREANVLLAAVSETETSQVTVIPAEMFAALVASLDDPDDAPRLGQAFARHAG